MRRPIPTDRYWELRAKQLDLAMLQERARSAAATRASMQAVLRMAAVVQAADAIVENSVDAGKTLVALAQNEVGVLVQAVGKEVGMTGDPGTWNVELGSDPGSAYIEGGDPNG